MSVSLFDVGGTLVDTVNSKIAALREFSEEKKLGITDEEFNDFLKGLHIDRTRTRDLVDTILGFRVLVPTESDYELFRNIENKYPKNFVPGALDFLNKLKDEGHTLGIVTNRRNFTHDSGLIPPELCDLFPPSHIFYRESTSMPKKPEPDLYKKALSSLGANISDVTVYEDTPRGLQSAINAGIINCVGMLTSDHHDANQLIEHGAKTVRKNYLEK